MSFLSTQPEELAAAAGKLDTVGAAMDAQNVAAAAPTTGVIPAAADEVSALQASLFTAYGSLYQQVSAEAAAAYQMFVNTLQISAGTYADTEAANSAAAASPFSTITSLLGAAPNPVPPWISDLANIVNIGVGNWASAASDLIGLASGGLLPAVEQTEIADAAADAAAGGLAATALEPAAAAGLGAAPLAAASSIGALSVPPSWAGPATLVSSVTSLQGAGWTAAATQAVPVTAIPGLPGLASATRNSAGFGAPRYGAKPIVMPKPAVG
ncbi:PPE family protein, SVP subgroup [Mycobacterium angelicum]|uniref:PE family protein n=1 Tax=Mycobacterium angelicum TaxID=470074 RepID=A0A1X0A5A2_MYCAN|nr:PE domain-containing protein [Mycobacterium angelicum]MCV7197018.1 PE domain-containing protein [Mycobacterium angelicum]ORA25263.1 PE family protein [Mycobacterium angelicum]